MIPLLPDRTATQLIDGEKWHATIIDRDSRLSLWQDMEQNKEKTVYMDDSEVLHIPGLSFDGVSGKSLITLARQSWGIGLGAEKHLAKQQKKGYAGGLMLEAPVGAFRDEGQAKEFLKHVREQHEGAENAGKIALLREGIKANVLSMNNSDSQFLEQRRFQREDAALLFLLEGILGDSSNASYNSLEARNLAFRQNCLAKWTTTWEEECDLKLLTESERSRGFYHKWNDGALLRMEKSAAMAFASQGIASRVLNPNECRTNLFDLNPYEGGDEYANPAIDKKDNGPGGANNQPNNATNLLLSNLLGVEIKRVKQSASNPATFMERVEKFYSKWQESLADKIEAIGGDRELATEHCEESKRRLLAASECQPDELEASVAKCVESWPSRVHQLIEGLEICCG